MVKSRKEDERLAACRQHWERHHEDWALSAAIFHCHGSNTSEPEWLRKAIYRVGHETLIQRRRPKKEGRREDPFHDYIIYSRVELHRRNGLKGDKPFEKAEQEFHLGFDAVKKAHGRHRRRAKQFDPQEKTIYSLPLKDAEFDAVQAFDDLRFWSLK